MKWMPGPAHPLFASGAEPRVEPTPGGPQGAVELNGVAYRWPSRPVVVCIDGGDPAYFERGIADGVVVPAWHGNSRTPDGSPQRA